MAAVAVASALAPAAAGAPGGDCGLPPAPTVAEAAGWLAGSDESSDPHCVAAALDALRAAGPAAAPAAPAVAALLPYRHPIYRNRDKLLVVRLRAYLVVTLADLGAAAAAMPALVDSLGHVDEGSAALELAAAARAARALGERGRPFITQLLEATTLRIASEEISLERFSADFPRSEATTVQLEAVAALASLVRADDHEACAALTNLAEYRGDALDRRLVRAARAAVERIQEQR